MHIAVVDDELSMREFLEVLLSRQGYRVSTAATFAEFQKLIGAERVDLVVSDMKLGRDSGLSVLKAARGLADPPEVILITAYGTPASAVEAMRQGAYDYITKPFDNDELQLLVRNALEKRSLRDENKKLRDALPAMGGSVLASESAAMAKVWQLVDKVAPTRSTVLVTGESGTGKEVVARVLHLKSPRAAQPFVAVNCAALAEGVLESELFGHMRGAFTGATQDRKGILVSAGEGTVLLDEIGEIPLSVQVKLLRVLQERKVKPVGATTEQPFEARLIAATNKNLPEEVKAGRFREDLFFRLNVINVELPPLRERREDIPVLARFFLSRFAAELGRPALELSGQTMALLTRFPFDGNVRQLENIIERAATLSETDVIQPSSLPPSVRGEQSVGDAAAVQLGAGFSLERFLDDAERRHLLEALAQSGGAKMRAAQLLGLSFRSFRYRLAKHGLSERDEP
jgi:two-component system, NtrC family, response regulator PilR